MSLYAIPYTRRFAPNFLRVANWLDRNFSESCQLFAFFFSLIGYIKRLNRGSAPAYWVNMFLLWKTRELSRVAHRKWPLVELIPHCSLSLLQKCFYLETLKFNSCSPFAVILSHFKGWREKGKGICICQIRLRSGEKKTLPTDELTKQLDKG